MSATLNSATAGASIIGSEQATDGGASGAESVTHSAAQTYSSGTANGQSQHLVTATINVNTSGTTLDLTAIAGGVNNATRNFATIQEILIENVDQANGITIGPGASNGWTGINGTTTGSVPLEAATASTGGGRLQRGSPNAGMTVDGTHKTILIAAASSTANVKYTILGRGS